MKLVLPTPPRLQFAHAPGPLPANGGEPARPGVPEPWWSKLLDQILTSLLVGGIVFIATLGPGWELQWLPALKGSALAFLYELRRYRNARD